MREFGRRAEIAGKYKNTEIEFYTIIFVNLPAFE
jgi:hypothetical protein